MDKSKDRKSCYGSKKRWLRPNFKTIQRKKPSGETLKEQGMLHLSPEERDAISLVIMDGKLPSQIAKTQEELLRIRGLIKSGLNKIQDWLLSEEHNSTN